MSFVLAPFRARAQSAEADGARARNRTGFSVYDYEHEKPVENTG
jgi:hypothetical protein